MTLFKNYIVKQWKLFIIPFFAMIICICADSSYPYFQKIFIDNIILGNNHDYLTIFLGIISMIALLHGLFAYINEFLFDKFALIICKKLRQDLYTKFQSFEFSFFDNNNTGELLSRIIEDVDVVWDTLAFGLRLLIEAIILFSVSVTIMFSINKTLTIICLIVLLPVAYIGMIMDKKFWNVYSQISDQTAEINSIVQQDVSGIRLVKAFAREKYEISKFLKVNQKFYDLNVDQAKIVGTYGPLIELLTNSAPILMIIYGGYLCIQGNLSFGSLVAFTSYIFNLSWCVRNLGAFINLLSQNKASMSKIADILNRKSAIVSKNDSYNPTDVKGDIVFKNVSFSYNNIEILHNINLNIPHGSTVAIMGTTGCGKSTLLSLIGRYYDVTAGEILVDNVNVKDWNLETLRANMSVVFQDTFLFSDTIKNNIDFGSGKSESALIKAVKDSTAHSFIKEMPEGFDTIIGERGLGLSGGQKQRLAISRAIIRKSPILILDDSTSALDMETEFKVLQNLKNDKKKTTTFIIAHRISGVKDADIILFMKDGKIIEKGTHSSLVNSKGYYFNVYSHQFQDFEALTLEAN
ncbi:ATP-binding cassette subfamily B protein [Clostridium saccharoperbutylacetonicum]|uniref:ABC-type multidrug transport system, ATPase and permease component n=1 Tax=Clostridium saccharoperbutylacetonicum N1-4(HMT) TaxID=931276 RepID=M1MLK3_9CLOT|nr:ABC transporter ATP-binding protein [Clostridium saccharoperbutylacetonicum]AGF57123.1 ABC-type multidrug transport system, ATPase and permease component [Clostridium saccharoperbutylacetonicum N1-4(HMT)]NRT62118.1 ATP-binding cassette subfamily B protein [Clostridium saccharoperbutylacetonicum]NSB25448.1 ATP-binding cassette subfamily B protein [Clostridium saccharoperbutylacetonicum]NSB44818.1 ATP-binding cassette subfamily B protein [Clostridium saccharoperbutylacetonicum]